MVPLKMDEVTALLLFAAEDGRRPDASLPCVARGPAGILAAPPAGAEAREPAGGDCCRPRRDGQLTGARGGESPTCPPFFALPPQLCRWRSPSRVLLYLVVGTPSSH